MAATGYDPPPLNWLLCAKDYLALAKSGHEAELTSCLNREVPLYNLCGHAFELTFKAFLLCKKHPEDNLKKRFGHNLLALYAECLRCGLARISHRR